MIAFNNLENQMVKEGENKKSTSTQDVVTLTHPIANAWAVDASCLGNPGPMEYQCIDLSTGRRVFHFGPVKKGTNNIGEFLALVHALALLDQKGISGYTVYTDSRTALAWVRKKKAKTTFKASPDTQPLLDLVARAERWLNTHSTATKIEKWPTEEWGEIPADFGRK